MVLRGRNLRAPLPCSTIPEIRNWWLSVSTVSPTFRCFEEANRSSTMMSSGPSNGPPDRYRKPPLTASKELRSMPSMTSTTPAVESWVTTGATATTCGSFMILSATLTETGAPLTPINSDELGGCTMMSAPIPACRFRLSSSMPTDKPTISRMSVTSTATATTLIMVRNGRCTRLARIIRFMEWPLFAVRLSLFALCSAKAPQGQFVPTGVQASSGEKRKAKGERRKANSEQRSLPPPVIHRELKSRIRREEIIDLPQTLCQRIRRQQGIIAFPQVLVVQVQIQRQHVHRDGIGKGSQQVLVLRLLGFRAAGGGDFA